MYSMTVTVQELPGVLLVEGSISYVGEDRHHRDGVRLLPAWVASDDDIDDPIAAMFDGLSRWARDRGKNYRMQLVHNPSEKG